MVYVVSLSWLWLALGYLFLVGILFGVLVAIPSLLRVLILKIYGIGWFSCIAHSIAGAIGSVVFILNSHFYVLVDSKGNEIFFLSGLWEMAPLKTFLWAFPFSGIIISMIYSTIIAPIYIKFSGENI